MIIEKILYVLVTLFVIVFGIYFIPNSIALFRLERWKRKSSIDNLRDIIDTSKEDTDKNENKKDKLLNKKPYN